MEHVPASARFAVIGSAAFFMTALSFYVMQMLIKTGLEAPQDEPPELSAPVMPAVERDKPEVRQRAMRVVPAELPPTPEGTPIAPSDVMRSVKADRPTFGSVVIDPGESDFELYPPVQDLIPLYVVQPVYPFRAVMKEVEGYVIVNFNVRANGTVQNPVVVESIPGTLFDEAALSAVAKFKFQPRMVGGDAIPVNDVQLRFVFRLGVDGRGLANVEGSGQPAITTRQEADDDE